MKLVRIVTALAIAATALGAHDATAQVQERTLRWAQQNSATHPQGLGAQKFADLVAEKSGGKITLKIFPSGQLGGDLQNISALQGGTLDMMVMNAGLLVGVVPDFALLDLPFVFESGLEADAVTDGPVGDGLYAKLPEKGLIGLGFFELGFRHVTNSRGPITKAEDFAGIKLRVVQSPLFIDLFSALGTNSVAMPFPEVYPALEQRVIDGQENPFAVIADNKFNEVQKFLSVTGHIYNTQSVLISKKTWDKLSAEEQGILTSAMAEAETFQRETARRVADEARAKLAAEGMAINDIDPAEMARIREKAEPVVAKYAAQAGPGVFEAMQAAIAKVRATN